MAGFYTIDDLPALQNAAMGRRVILRADLNVPMGDGTVSDATRIERLAPTIAELAAKGFRVVVISHFGRPGGKRDATLSLAPITGALQAAFGSPVIFVAACSGAEAEAAVGGLGVGGVALMENLRFHPGEEANYPEFARALARLGDIYVNDAFSVAHRAHASTEALARLLPAAAGRLMQAELEALAAALETPKRPVLAVIGGAKVSTKLDLLANSAQPTGDFPNSLVWFSVPKNSRAAPRWERHVFADKDAPGLSHYLGFGDVNGDDRPDAAAAAKGGPTAEPGTGDWFAGGKRPLIQPESGRSTSSLISSRARPTFIRPT